MVYDMKPNLNNPYGYKVCYKEKGAKDYIRHFLAYTYRQAKLAKNYYIRYPTHSREDNHLLRKPEWVIIPIKKSEVRAGIWREVPFDRKGFFTLYKQILKIRGGLQYENVKSNCQRQRARAYKTVS